MFPGAVVWGVAALAALGLAAAIGFYAVSGRPLSQQAARRVSENALELRRQATELGTRPLWKFQIGLVVGVALSGVGLVTGSAALPLAAVGALLATLSLIGLLLVLGGRRRLEQLKKIYWT
ncbi:MAG: hypothetical protein ACE5KX_05380 [Acidimicrobiia bacterium]